MSMKAGHKCHGRAGGTTPDACGSKQVRMVVGMRACWGHQLLTQQHKFVIAPTPPLHQQQPLFSRPCAVHPCLSPAAAASSGRPLYDHARQPKPAAAPGRGASTSFSRSLPSSRPAKQRRRRVCAAVSRITCHEAEVGTAHVAKQATKQAGALPICGPSPSLTLLPRLSRSCCSRDRRGKVGERRGRSGRDAAAALRQQSQPQPQPHVTCACLAPIPAGQGGRGVPGTRE